MTCILDYSNTQYNNLFNRGTGHISAFSTIIDYGMKMLSSFAGTVLEFYLLLLLWLKKGQRRQ